MTDKELLEFEKKGYELESRILHNQEIVRKQTAAVLDSNLTNSRIFLASLFFDLMKIREGVPGNSDETTSKVLSLITTYIQGFGITENLIYEGQYSKVASVLKQEYEILTRIKEHIESAAKEGKTPNVKHAPKGSQRIYGKLNDISHPSNSDIILDLIYKEFDGQVNAVSPIPVFNEEYAINLYKSHLFVGYEILKENVMLIADFYGIEILDELERNGFFEYVKVLRRSLLQGKVIEEKNNNANN